MPIIFVCLIVGFPIILYVVYYILKLRMLKRMYSMPLTPTTGKVLDVEYHSHYKASTGIVYRIQYTDNYGNPHTAFTEEYPLKKGTPVFKVGDSVKIVYTTNYELVFFSKKDLEKLIQAHIDDIKSLVVWVVIILVFGVVSVVAKRS